MIHTRCVSLPGQVEHLAKLNLQQEELKFVSGSPMQQSLNDRVSNVLIGLDFLIQYSQRDLYLVEIAYILLDKPVESPTRLGDLLSFEPSKRSSVVRIAHLHLLDWTNQSEKACCHTQLFVSI